MLDEMLILTSNFIRLFILESGFIQFDPKIKCPLKMLFQQSKQFINWILIGKRNRHNKQKIPIFISN